MGSRISFNKLTNLTGLEFSLADSRKQGAVLFDVDLPTQIQRIDGPIAVDISTGPLNNLTHLNVASVKSTSLADWENLPSLEFFAGEFAKIPEKTEAKLTSLIARQTRINVATHKKLNQFTNLKYLKFACSYSRDLDLALTNLETLDISGIPNSVKVHCDSTRLTSLKTATLMPTSTHHTALKSLTIQTGRYSRMNDKDLEALGAFPYLEELGIDVQEDGAMKGKFLQFMNPKTLTKLSVGIKTTIDEISSFTNLCELNLVLQQSTDIEILSKLLNLTKLAVGGIKTPELDWLNRLTNLRAVYLDFLSTQNSNEVPLDLADLTNLRTLVITPRTNKAIKSLTKLTLLEKLEFPMTYENVFDYQWPDLTSLSFHQAPSTEHISKLTQLRELDCVVATNDEIARLTSLQKMTRFICRSVTANSLYLTHLTSLQSVAFSNKISVTDWTDVQPWSYYNAYPDVVRHMPNFVPGAKDKETLTYCFTLLYY